MHVRSSDGFLSQMLVTWDSNFGKHVLDVVYMSRWGSGMRLLDAVASYYNNSLGFPWSYCSVGSGFWSMYLMEAFIFTLIIWFEISGQCCISLFSIIALLEMHLG